MDDNETATALKTFRRKLCMLRLGLYGAVAQHTDSWVSLGVVIGEVEDLIGSTQEMLVAIEPGADFMPASVFEPGPASDEPIN